MALFGFFKSKTERLFENPREIEATLKRIHDTIFPNGESDVDRDVSRVSRIVKGKIPSNEIRSFVLKCKSLLYIKGQAADESITESFKRDAQQKISSSEALDIYAYFDGEAHYIDLWTIQMKSKGVFSLEKQKQFQESYAEKLKTASYGNTIDNGHGEFGLVPTNPVPTISIRCSNQYLSRLRWAGACLESQRQGSTQTDATAGNVDIYQLSQNGRQIAKVYVCPYHKRNSQLAPLGFTLA
jgi:hypothetical protein